MSGQARRSMSSSTRRTSCSSPCGGGCATSAACRDVAELLLPRGVEVTHETIRAWEFRFAPRAGRPSSAANVAGRAGVSWYLDETYVKIAWVLVLPLSRHRRGR